MYVTYYPSVSLCCAFGLVDSAFFGPRPLPNYFKSMIPASSYNSMLYNDYQGSEITYKDERKRKLDCTIKIEVTVEL
jgi:hypothetical protein